jgi:hypothetical protein
MPETPSKPGADDILARVDRLLNRDAPKRSAAAAQDIPTLSDVLTPGQAAPVGETGIDRNALVRELTRQIMPALEMRIAEDVRKQLTAELGPALNRAIDAAVAAVRLDLIQAVNAAVEQAARNYTPLK